MEPRNPMQQLDLEFERRNECRERIEQLKNYLKDKLYFQYLELSLKYISEVGDTQNRTDPFEFLMYAIMPLKENFDPLKFAMFVGEALSRSPENTEKKVELLNELISKDEIYDIKEYKNASLTQEQNVTPKQEIKGDLYFRCLLALEYSKSSTFSIKCEEVLNFLTNKLGTYRGLEREILSIYHKSYALYEKTMGRVSRFYRQSMQYLSFTPLHKIPQETKPLLVYELIIAAIISEDVYNLGELVLHPIVLEFSSILKGDYTESVDSSIRRKYEENAWVLDILVSIHEGDIDTFMRTITKNQDKVKNTPLSTPEVRICVTKKTTTLALMDLAFKKNKDERILTFDEIAKHCRIDTGEIELLVMKAINMNLIKGIIDQVSQRVEINWVHSRVLDKTRMKLLIEKLDNWIDSASNLVSQIETIAPEMVSS
ncbi:putative 26S proteasome regulatory subunit RPN9 [Cryptosporidium felis]|nr:putative 26S proteasome regulatory subunit RPN9 [Cryptosporidium felis]